MRILIGYKKIIKSFRHKRKETYIPIYKDVGKGGQSDKFRQIELRRET